MKRREKTVPISDPLQEKLASMEKTMQERNKRDGEELTQSAEIIQLPLWEEPARGTPHDFLRGALFAGIQGKTRQCFKRELLATQDGFGITYTGWQLDQGDLDVWEMAVHLARLQPLGNHIEFSGHGFLKAIGRNTGKSDYEWLLGSKARLGANWMEIKREDQKVYEGSLLIDGERDDITKRHVLQINPKMLKLYAAGYTEIDFEQRILLKRKPLAQWLHGFLATHKKPHPMKIETYRRLSGSNTKQRKHFKVALIRALDELVKIYYIRAYEIIGDKVHITRTASDQRIHGRNRYCGQKAPWENK